MPTWNTPNSQHTYTVPDAAVLLAIIVRGGVGGSKPSGTSGDGGAGGEVVAEFDPRRITELEVYVGENGQTGDSGEVGPGGQSPLNSAGDGGVPDSNGLSSGGGAESQIRLPDGTILAVGDGGGGSGSDSDNGGGGGGGARGGVGGTTDFEGDGQDATGTGFGGDGGDANALDGSQHGENGGTETHSDLESVNTGTSTSGPVVEIVAKYPPAAPQSLTAVDVRETEADLTWTDDDSQPETTQEAGFRAFTSRDGQSWTQQADLAADTESHTITGLLHGEQYWIQVEAYNDYGRSGTPTLLVDDGNSVTEASPTSTIWQTQIEGEYITES